MTLRYRLDQRSGRFYVCGPIEEVTLGLVEVTRANGETKTECVIKLGPTFDTPTGPMRIGYTRVLPARMRTRNVDKPQQTPVVTRTTDDPHTVEIAVDVEER